MVTEKVLSGFDVGAASSAGARQGGDMAEVRAARHVFEPARVVGFIALALKRRSEAIEVAQPNRPVRRWPTQSFDAGEVGVQNMIVPFVTGQTVAEGPTGGCKSAMLWEWSDALHRKI